MAKKKEEAVVEEQTAQPLPPAPESKPIKKMPSPDDLVSVVTLEPFVDGNLAEAFGKYGYEANWPSNSVRKIPRWLVKRVIQSGGSLEVSE